jgi:hypothetical protein
VAFQISVNRGMATEDERRKARYVMDSVGRMLDEELPGDPILYPTGQSSGIVERIVDLDRMYLVTIEPAVRSVPWLYSSDVLI